MQLINYYLPAHYRVWYYLGMDTFYGYDAWKTTPPDDGDAILQCDACGYEHDAPEHGDACPECEDGIMLATEPLWPCYCTGHCYC